MRMQIKFLGLCAVILMAIGSASAQTCTADVVPVTHDLLMGDGAGNMSDSGILSSNVPLLNASANAFTGTLAVSGNTNLGGSYLTAPLSVGGNSGTTQAAIAAFSNQTNGASTEISSAGTSSAVGTWTNGSQIVEFVPISSGNGVVSSYTGSLLLQTGGRANRMVITSAGNVGVGTVAPGADLATLPSPPQSGTTIFQVNGDIALAQTTPGGHIYFSDGSVQATAWNGTAPGGDYAEAVDVIGSRQQYEPGDVMVIDPASPDKFLKSQEPYSTMVAGIYSTKPGLTGRRQKSTDAASREAEVPMAMMGIVPTKVTAENGAIKPGDLMVASSTAGYAMKGTDRERLMGAVIGKAMGHLNAGTGVIEVLVSLQ
jgi:hypothetical protein